MNVPDLKILLSQLRVDAPTVRRTSMYKIGAIGDSITQGCNHVIQSLSAPSTRINSHAYSLHDFITWTTGSTIWECTTAGTSSSSPPSITGKNVGNTVVDGTATWTLRAPGVVSSVGTTMYLYVPAHDGNYGMPFHLMYADQAEYNGVFVMGSGTMTNIITATFAGSATPVATGSIQLSEMYKFTTKDWLGYACGLAGGTIERGWAIGFPGMGVDYVLANYVLLAPDKPDAVVVLVGVNDLTGGTPPTTIYGKLKQVWSGLVQLGITPIKCTLPPDDNFNATQQAQWIKLNTLIRQEITGRGNGKYELWDFARAVSNPATGLWQSGFSTGGVHPDVGAWVMGQEGYNSMVAGGLVRANPSPLSCCQLESYATNSASRQLLSNPLGINTGGTVTSPATGSCIANWTLDVLGSVTSVAGSIVERSDGFGYDQQIDTATNNNGTGFNFYGQQYSQNLEAGSTIFMAAEFNLSNLANFKALQFELLYYYNGLIGYVAAGKDTGVPSNTSNKTYTAVTYKFVLPVTATWVQPYIFAYHWGAGGTSRVKIGRPAIWSIPTS